MEGHYALPRIESGENRKGKGVADGSGVEGSVVGRPDGDKERLEEIPKSGEEYDRCGGSASGGMGEEIVCSCGCVSVRSEVSRKVI